MVNRNAKHAGAREACGWLAHTVALSTLSVGFVWAVSHVAAHTLTVAEGETLWLLCHSVVVVAHSNV